MRKIVETRSSLSNTIKDTSTIMRNPSLHNSDIGVTHDCASILDSIAKGTSCFHYFSHGASLHRHSFSRMIFTLVSDWVAYHARSLIRTGLKPNKNYHKNLQCMYVCTCTNRRGYSQDRGLVPSVLSLG